MGTTDTPAFLQVAPGILQWSVYHEEKDLDFNGHVILDPDGNVIIDPPELDPRQLDDLWTRGGVAHVIVTNRHHGRRTAELVNRTQARVHAHRKDAGALDVTVDDTFVGGDRLPGGLLAIEVPHSKSPGETALFREEDGGTLILGDALIGKPAGEVSLLPDDKFADPKAALKGLRVLLEHEYERVLLGDGQAPDDGKHAIEEFLVHHGVTPRRKRL